MKRWLAIGALTIGCILVIFAFVSISGIGMGSMLRDIVSSAFGSGGKISSTIRHTTPLLIASVSVFVAMRAGLFNIGAEGQFIIGALGCAMVGDHIAGPIGLVLAITVGIIWGALWALPAGLIKAYRGGHEVITTIMLNSVAEFFAMGLASGPLKEPGQQSPQTPQILTDLVSFHMGSLDISLGTIIAVLLPVGLAFWLVRSVRGYETEAVGANPTAAASAGIDVKKVIWKTMAVSGGIAGLAGAIQVAAYSYRFFPEISSGTGFDALGVALLAGSLAPAIIPAALAFGVLYQASPLLQIDGLPKGATDVILSVLIVVGAAVRFRRFQSRG